MKTTTNKYTPSNSSNLLKCPRNMGWRTFTGAIWIILVIATQANAQLKRWSFPPYYVTWGEGALWAIPFPTPHKAWLDAVPTNIYNGDDPIGAHNMICDSSGKILCFVADGRIYDNQG